MKGETNSSRVLAPFSEQNSALIMWWQSLPFWAFIALISAAPMLIPSFPMMPDYFNHVGRYHVMNFGAQSAFLPKYYDFEWNLIGNLGVDLLMIPLGRSFGTELGARVAAALIPMLSVAGLYCLSRAIHGRVQAGAVVALPLIWNMSLAFGFVNYCLAVALAMLVSAWWIAQRQRDTRPSTWLLMLLGLLTWTCHLMGWAIICVIIGWYEVVRALQHDNSLSAAIRQTVSFAWPLIVPLLPMVAGFWLGAHTQSVSGVGEHPSLWEKKGWLISVVKNSWRGFDILSFLWLAFASALVLIHRNFRGHSIAILLAGGTLIAAFLMFPPRLMGSYYADQRLLAPGWMLLLVGAGAMQPKRFAPIVVAALFLFVTRLTVLTQDWVARAAQLATDLELLEKVPIGARIAVGAPPGNCTRWTLDGLDQAASLAIVRREAFVTTEWNFAGYLLLFPRWTAGIDPLRVDTAISTPQRVCTGDSVPDFLRDLPRERFGYVWLFEASANVPWLREIGAGPNSVLYKIGPIPVPDGRGKSSG